MTSRYYKRELFNRADENQTKRKKPPKHVSPITVQLQDNDSAAITNVTNLDKQTFASVAKFRGETLREVKTLQRSAAPTVSSEEASAITGSDNHLSTIPAHQAATQSFRCQFTAVPTAIAQSEQRLAMGWTVRGPNSGGGDIFPHPSRTALGPPSLLYNGYRVFFPG